MGITMAIIMTVITACIGERDKVDGDRTLAGLTDELRIR